MLSALKNSTICFLLQVGCLYDWLMTSDLVLSEAFFLFSHDLNYYFVLFLSMSGFSIFGIY